ncbi:unnamed protein product [Dovyalis caffra]|uniref:Uncharacterized protein n=1 Tax=Dovyalis caffra TaxID=77055 RepID=A0AAV1R590_9ROSI|nr:unnamed protein product [Dovyalis caffra]
MEVQITSRKLITPSSPTPPHLQNLKISSFDLPAPNFYVPTIFFYPTNGAVNNAEKSLQLQKSLSEILTLYYPLAGRYAKDDPLIECNDKGAEFLEAKVNGSLSQLLGDEGLEIRTLNHLALQKFDPNNSSPLAVQFNIFECGGIAIGISITHKIADSFTGFTFINAWATACRIGVQKVHRPSFELGSIFPPSDASRTEKFVVSRASTNKNIVTKSFVFDAVAISNLKAAASASGSELPVEHLPARVKVVTAIIWRAFVRLVQARHGSMRPSLLTVPVNLRGKTNLSIPENLCGNFRSWATLQFMPNGTESEVQFHDLVSRIHGGIENTVSNYAKASSSDDLFLTVINDFRKVSEAVKESDADVYMFSSWCQLPLYEADFGWGKPSLLRRGGQVQKEMILLLDTKDGDGIEAWVSLEEENMLLFQQDPDIVAFTC